MTAVVTAGAALAGGPSAALGGRTWTIKPTPDPVGAEISVLSSVACSSARACTAVGSSAASLSSITLPLAERWDGNSWRIQPTPGKRWRLQPAPHPSGFAHGALLGISCASARCAAVGAYAEKVHIQDTLAMAR